MILPSEPRTPTFPRVPATYDVVCWGAWRGMAKRFWALLVLAWASSAHASGFGAFNAGISFANRNDPDSAIAQLTSALTSADLPLYLKETAFLARARSYSKKDEAEPALADYRSAIALNPYRSSTYYDRGFLLRKLKRLDEAADDFSHVITLQPTTDDGYVALGEINLRRGRYPLAVAEFTQVLGFELESPQVDLALGGALWAEGAYVQAEARFNLEITNLPNPMAEIWRTYSPLPGPTARGLSISTRPEPDAYAVLWRELAALGAGQTPNFTTDSQDIDEKKWPAPVVKFFRGEETADAVLGEAAKSAESLREVRKCEADFYIGEWQLMEQKDVQRARTSLSAAAAGDPDFCWESTMAGIELARLTVVPK